LIGGIAILEFDGGEYAGVEIKLGYHQVEDAKKIVKKITLKLRKKVFRVIF